MKTKTMYEIKDCDVKNNIVPWADDYGMPDGGEYSFKSFDKYEIREKLKDLKANDNNFCIEIYWTDNDGEFLEGSDYDTPTNFIKNIELR